VVAPARPVIAADPGTVHLTGGDRKSWDVG
jgi:hypothetical protein